MDEKLKDVLEGLTDAQKEAAKACRTENELAEFLSGLGVALPDELLESAAGGFFAPGRVWWQQGGSFQTPPTGTGEDSSGLPGEQPTIQTSGPVR